jgi:cystathionine beta-synthase
VLERPVSEVMSPAMPMIGIGEPVARVVERLDSSAAVLVLDGGHPVGVLSRSDLLAFLASRAAG